MVGTFFLKFMVAVALIWAVMHFFQSVRPGKANCELQFNAQSQVSLHDGFGKDLTSNTYFLDHLKLNIHHPKGLKITPETLQLQAEKIKTLCAGK